MRFGKSQLAGHIRAWNSLIKREVFVSIRPFNKSEVSPWKEEKRQLWKAGRAAIAQQNWRQLTAAPLPMPRSATTLRNPGTKDSRAGMAPTALTPLPPSRQSISTPRTPQPAISISATLSHELLYGKLVCISDQSHNHTFHLPSVGSEAETDWRWNPSLC